MNQLSSGTKIVLCKNNNNKGLLLFSRNSKKMLREQGDKRNREGMSRSGERRRRKGKGNSKQIR